MGHLPIDDDDDDDDDCGCIHTYVCLKHTVQECKCNTCCIKSHEEKAATHYPNGDCCWCAPQYTCSNYVNKNYNLSAIQKKEKTMFDNEKYSLSDKMESVATSIKLRPASELIAERKAMQEKKDEQLMMMVITTIETANKDDKGECIVRNLTKSVIEKLMNAGYTVKNNLTDTYQNEVDELFTIYWYIPSVTNI